MKSKYDKLIISAVLLTVIFIIFSSINQLNSINPNYFISNTYILLISILIIVDYFLFNELLKSIINRNNISRIILLTYIPVILLLFTTHFYSNVSYLIRDFRNLLGSAKFLYGFTITGFVFSKVLVLLYLSRKTKLKIKPLNIIILVLYLLSFFSLWEYFQQAKGDEIEYYVNIHSMTYERNLNIYNDVLYREIICNTTILPVISVHSKDKLITQHSSNILFHIIFIIPYYLLKRYGIMLTLNFIFALTFYQILKFLKYHYLTFIILLFPAFTVYSTKLYPEIFPVLLLFFLLNNINKIDIKPLIYGIINGLLLLLNLRFIIISGGIAFYFFIKLKTVKKKFLFCVPIVVFVLIHLLFNFIVYDCFSIAANTGGKELNNFTMNNYETLLKLIFDQEYGIFLFNPIIIFFISVFYIIRKERKLYFILSSLGIYLLFLTFYGNNWWGGVSPPFRFLFSLVAVYYALYILFLTKTRHNAFIRYFSYILNFLTITISYILVSVPNFQYSERWRGTNQILEKLHWYFRINLMNLFPGYHRNLNTNTVYYWISIILLTNILTLYLIIFNSKKINNIFIDKNEK